jgi:hypothetical protein
LLVVCAWCVYFFLFDTIPFATIVITSLMQQMSHVRLLIFLFFCGALFCSNPFKPSTDEGQTIVNDVDSSITNINQNIKTFAGGALIDTAFSRRDIHDTIAQPLQRNPSVLAVGAFSGLTSNGIGFSDTSVAYIEFRPGLFRQTAWVIARNDLKAATTVFDSVVFVVHRLRISARGHDSMASIDVFTCETMKDSVLFDAAKITGNSIAAFSGISLDSAGPDSMYSVILDTATYFNKIRSAVSDTGTDTAWFAFCLKPSLNSNGVVRLYGALGSSYDPRIVFYFHDKTDPTDSIKSWAMPLHHASVSVFEPNFGPDSSNGAKAAVSSRETARRAVFKLDLAPLKTFMEDSAAAGKKFVVIQRADLSLNVAQSMSDLSSDSIRVFYNVSDTLATEQHSFKTVNSFTVIRSAPSDTTYVLSLANWIQPLIVNKNLASVYLYLTVPDQLNVVTQPFVQVDWENPAGQMKINAIVTNPR